MTKLREVGVFVKQKGNSCKIMVVALEYFTRLCRVHVLVQPFVEGLISGVLIDLPAH
jgi:hypothetical protein